MSTSPQEGIAQFPQTKASKERFAAQKIESVQTMDELLELLEQIGTIDDSEKVYFREDIMAALGRLLSALRDLKILGELPVCDLAEFPKQFGLRRTIGRLLKDQGYLVNDAVFNESMEIVSPN